MRFGICSSEEQSDLDALTGKATEAMEEALSKARVRVKVYKQEEKKAAQSSATRATRVKRQKKQD